MVELDLAKLSFYVVGLHERISSPTWLIRSVVLGREKGSRNSREAYLVYQLPGNGNVYELNQGFFVSSAQALCIRRKSESESIRG
jgi:hypothetical protein